MHSPKLHHQINARLDIILPDGLTDQVARALMAALFIMAGAAKIGAYEGNLAYMTSAGVPGVLLPSVIALELLGGVALLIGLQTRLVALALALFSISSALLFHFDLGDQGQVIHLFKNLAIAGGLVLLSGARPGAWSIDRKLGA